MAEYSIYALITACDLASTVFAYVTGIFQIITTFKLISAQLALREKRNPIVQNNCF